jgi:hypothetical protein
MDKEFEVGDEVKLAMTANPESNFRAGARMKHGSIGIVARLGAGGGSDTNKVYVTYDGETNWYTNDELVFGYVTAGQPPALDPAGRTLNWPSYSETSSVIRRAENLLDPSRSSYSVGTPDVLYELIIKLANKIEEQNAEIFKLTPSQTDLDIAIEEIESAFYNGEYGYVVEGHVRTIIKAAQGNK